MESRKDSTDESSSLASDPHNATAAANSNGTPAPSSPFMDLEHLTDQIVSILRQSAVPMLAIVVSFILTGQSYILYSYVLLPLWMFAWRFLSTALGVALGLGLATYVYDRLEVWQQQQKGEEQEKALQRRRVVSSHGLLKKSAATSTTRLWTKDGDVDSYAALMASAGYDVSQGRLRGQVVASDEHDSTTTNYPYTHVSDPQQLLGSRIMKEQCPHLPDNISLQLGRWIEHIIRDFVASWYSMIDASCPYQDEKEYQKQQQQKDNVNNNDNTTPSSRSMILLQHRPIPMMHTMYQTLAVIFGELSSRAEHVNVLELVLLKWTRVLSMTLRTYRQLRQLAVTKQSMHLSGSGERSATDTAEEQSSAADPSTAKSSRTIASDSVSSNPTSSRSKRGRFVHRPVSEMSMTKEFLLAGKLHRALTFGMDVPSLLFADPSGKECGRNDPGDVNASGTVSSSSLTEERVLEDRLFSMLNACELDYNRVLSHRMCRALLPRNEFSSPILRTLMTEMMAGCILTPIMSCFGPDYLNYWITLCAPVEGEKSDDITNGEVAELSTENNEIDEGVENGFERVLEGNGDEGSIDVVHTDGRVNEPEDGEKANEAIEMTLSQVSFSSEAPAPDGNNEDKSHDGTEEGDTDADYGKQNAKEPEDSGDLILPLLTMAVIELQRFMDFEECRDARMQHEQMEIKWTETGCREAVQSLVLVIEAALIHGRREKRLLPRRENGETSVESRDEDLHDDETSFDDTMSSLRDSSLPQLLMEITSDLDAFEALVAQEEENMERRKAAVYEESDEEYGGPFKPTASELSTLRTLISAWLHTGQAFRTVSVLIRARQSILEPFFNENAFIRTEENAYGFVRQLKALDNVEILVDTAAILASATLDVSGKANVSGQLYTSPGPEGVEVSASPEINCEVPSLGPRSGGALRGSRLSRFISGSSPDSISVVDLNHQKSMSASSRGVGGSSIPRYLDFRRNQNFASSLRSERERRQFSWKAASSTKDNKGLKIVSRVKGSSEEDITHFRELHHIARVMYTGTNILGLRDGARRNDATGSVESATQASTVTGDDEGELTRLSLLTVEMASPRRRLEIPDDDSSFLLRAQPRPLNALGVHRDQMNHESSYKCFAATYDEPAFRPDSTRYTGGRYIRRCQLRYYPSDRTAAIVVVNDARSLDQRKEHKLPPETITVGVPSASSLPGDFLRKRHLCQKWNPRGAAPRSGSILASSVMEPSDFNAVPRAGKAIDFLYRMSLFERPMVELSGKLFTVYDSNISGTHRADASVLELSDASLSAALFLAGRDWEKQSSQEGKKICEDEEETQSRVEMGKDGYPVLWMKFSRKQGDKNVVEIKPYRTSYVRAAMMIASTRREAQHQCLVQCVRAGSAREATRQRTEALMQPTLKLLEFAASDQREKQAILLRDLKLGINHIDRDQLRRNSLLYPRYPTFLRSLKATVEGAIQAKDAEAVDGPGSMTVYKIRCVALVDIIDTEEDGLDLREYCSADGSRSSLFREEWVVHRPFKDFNILHKHLKTQVSSSETSASAGARLVGAFSAGGNTAGHRSRKSLIPSLGQATKAGALGVTKKSLQKRRAILDEYLRHLLSPSLPINQCAELMLFLGANHPLPPDARTGAGMLSGPDHLGRTDMFRTALDDGAPSAHESISVTSPPGKDLLKSNLALVEPEIAARPTESINDSSLRSPVSAKNHVSTTQLDISEEDDSSSSHVREKTMLPSIKAKIDRVPLSKARNAVFELIRSQFDFENASFFRNRLLSALKTMSFAVTGAGEFRNTLYDAHVNNLSSEALSGWLDYSLSMLWPEGVFFESSPPTTTEESKDMADKSLAMLSTLFPDQVRAIIGQEITTAGLEMLHEMIQNRAVTKSLAYMLFDLLWAEIFPELQDTLSGSQALQTE